jgi:hypothetical protein
MMLGLCIFAVACNSSTGSPTTPSSVVGVTEAQVQASGGPPVEVTFTKWIDPMLGFPSFTGVAGGDVPGDFVATVLSRNPFDNGIIVQLEARYEVIADDPTRSFVVVIEGKQNQQTQSAVLNGTVVEGWLTGARAHVTFDVISPCPQFNQSVCFAGTIRVLPGSAH